MTDPRRFLEGPAGELEAELLRSVEQDAPSARARSNTLVALGVGVAAFTPAGAAAATATKAVAAVAGAGAVTTVATTSKIAGGLTFAAVVKWVLVGTASSLIALTVAHELTRFVPSRAARLPTAPMSSTASVGSVTAGARASTWPQDPGPPQLLASSGVADGVSAASATVGISGGAARGQAKTRPSEPRPQGLDETPALRTPEARASGARESVTSAPQLPVARTDVAEANVGMGAGAAATASAPSSLSAEIAAIDEARQAIQDHDPAHALRLLDAYEQRFPRRELGPEANVVRIEALLQRGERRRAKALADEFLRANPTGPHSERVRTLSSAANQP